MPFDPRIYLEKRIMIQKDFRISIVIAFNGLLRARANSALKYVWRLRLTVTERKVYAFA
jgi:ribosomal protein S12